MLRGFFVTGTDTGLGKTVVAAALMHRCRPTAPVRYWKPIQTGSPQDDDTAVVRHLGACNEDEVFREGIRLTQPVSPHLAARLAGYSISLEDLHDLAAPQTDRFLIVEGAGGVLVPVNDRDLMVNLIVRLGLPAVVVARTSLGTINHTLLTLAALRAAAVPVAGVVMVGERHDENQAAIERFGRAAVLGRLPILDPLTPATVAAAAAGLEPRLAP
jgi:dethiobiotin synthase